MASTSDAGEYATQTETGRILNEREVCTNNTLDLWEGGSHPRSIVVCWTETHWEEDWYSTSPLEVQSPIWDKSLGSRITVVQSKGNRQESVL